MGRTPQCLRYDEQDPQQVGLGRALLVRNLTRRRGTGRGEVDDHRSQVPVSIPLVDKIQWKELCSYELYDELPQG